MDRPSQEGHGDLEQRMTDYFLLRMNQAALEDGLITEEVYRRIDAAIRTDRTA